jgi:L-lactate dehydrogenase complex protein LldG
MDAVSHRDRHRDSHREQILAGIRVALGERKEAAGIAAEYAAIARGYVGAVEHSREEVVAKFEERLLEYDAGVYRTDVTGIAAMIGEVLRGRGKSGLLMPAGVSSSWLPDGFSFAVGTAENLAELDGSQGILTGCTVAIAETGSMVLQNAAGQGARALSLVPDYHLCVVFAAQVVATVPEAFARLEGTSTLPTTFISGPSATADIEMTRIKGVHGPRFLDVLVVS